MSQPEMSPPEPVMMPPGKQRHGCLTAFIIAIIVVNSVLAFVYLVGGGALRSRLPGRVPGWVFPALVVLALFNVACGIGLWQWKKWAFWGFVASAGLALIINVASGLGVGNSLSGLLGVAVLYGVLQIGNGGNKGWPQLE